MTQLDLETIACGFIVAMILWFLGEVTTAFYRVFHAR